MELNVLGILSFLSDLIPFLFLITHRELLKKKLLRVLFVWTIVSLVADVLIVMFPAPNAKELLAFFSIILEVLFVCIFYYVIASRRSTKIISAGFGIAFALLSVYELCFQQLTGFQHWLAASAALVTMFLSALIFFDFFTTHQNSFLLANYEIWVPLAYMIYASGNLFLFATTEHFPNLFTEPGRWDIFLVANTIKNSFFIKSVQLAKKGKPRPFADDPGPGFTRGYI